VSSAEGGAARLTPKGLNLLDTAMLAIPNQGVHASVGLAKVRALPIGTGKSFGIYPDGALPGGFSPRSRGAREQALVLYP
jgi:hypothetical protein